MGKELTSFILHYLLAHCFSGKADMSRKLDLNKRVLQRILNDATAAKGGTIALEKALCYCAQYHISLDPILDEYDRFNNIPEAEAQYMKANLMENAEAAYTHLTLSMPDELTPEGIDVFISMRSFIQLASSHICPHCATWCNPWDGTDNLRDKDCYLAHMARSVYRDVAELYSKEAED